MGPPASVKDERQFLMPYIFTFAACVFAKSLPFAGLIAVDRPAEVGEPIHAPLQAGDAGAGMQAHNSKDCRGVMIIPVICCTNAIC